MNISKYLSVGLIALLGAAFTACDGKDEPDYQNPSKPAETQRVYFANSSVSEIVAADQTSIEVPVYRPDGEDNVKEALTVQLLTTDPSGLFTVPETVTFAENSNVAVITVGFNTANLTPNSPYALQIAVDEANADMYGIATVDLSVNYEVMTEWALFDYDKAAGRDAQGTWTLGAPFSGSLAPVRVFARWIPSNPDNMQFIMQVYGPEEDPDPDKTDMDDPDWIKVMEFNSPDGGKTINVPVQDAVADIFGDGMYFGDAHSMMPNRFPNASSFDKVSGTFTLNLMWADAEGPWSPGDNFIVLNGYADTKEYILSVSDAGPVNAGGTDYTLLDFQFNKNVSFVDYTIVSGELDEEQIAAVVEKMEDPAQTDYAISTIETAGTQAVTFPRSGKFTVVAVGYNVSVAGEVAPKTSASCVFDFVNNDPDADWKTINENAVFTENALGIMGVPEATYTVTFQQHLDFPTTYRIRAPYENWPYLAALEGNVELAPEVGSIVFDCEDPAKVVVDRSVTGLVVVGMGNLTLQSNVDGTLADKVITFTAQEDPQNPDFLMWFGADGPYVGNFNMALDFNDSAAAAAPRKAQATRKLGKLTPMRGITPAKASVPAGTTYKAVAYGEKAGRFNLTRARH